MLKEIMPNAPDPENTQFTLRISRLLRTKLEKLAKKRRVTLTRLLVQIAALETADIELTPEEHETLAQEIRKARAKKQK